MPIARSTWRPSRFLNPALAVRRRTMPVGIDAVQRLSREPADRKRSVKATDRARTLRIATGERDARSAV
jgi:hypothetical protein